MPEIKLHPDIFPSKNTLPTLCSFLEHQASIGHYFYSEQEIYSFQGESIVFSSDAICRPDPLESGYYCHFVGPLLGDGAFGTVYAIAETIAVQPLDFKTVSYSEEQVVKIQKHCSCEGEVADGNCDEHHSKLMLDIEARFAPKLTHLNLQTPLYNPDLKMSYSIMNRLPGMDLLTFLVECGSDLNLAMRLDLCVNLLKAVKEQVTDLNIIHRDLKSENMMVDSTTIPFKVNVIDYGSSREIPPGEEGLKAQRRVGTQNYWPPEALRRSSGDDSFYWHSFKMDVFAVGRLLVEVLRGPDESYSDGFGESDYQDYLDNDLLFFDDLYFYLDPLTQSEKNQLKVLLTSMLSLDSDQRCDIEYAFEQFSSWVGSIQQHLSLTELVAVPIKKRAWDYTVHGDQDAEFMIDDLLNPDVDETESDEIIEQVNFASLSLLSPFRVASQEPDFETITEEEDEEAAAAEEVKPFDRCVFEPIREVYPLPLNPQLFFTSHKKLSLRPWTRLEDVSEDITEEVKGPQAKMRLADDFQSLPESGIGTTAMGTPS